MKKIERLQNIIYFLSQDNRISASELAEIFEVSPRTIYRDIDALSQMKVPIITYEGLNGGYELESSYFFKTVQLNDKELMMMGLLLKIGHHLNTTDFDESIVTLKNKLINASGKETNMSETMENITIDIQNIYPKKIKKGIFITVLEALKSRRKLSISYFTPLKDSWTLRTITPTHLFYSEGCWYLTSYCYMKKARRMFRLDRIDKCDLLNDFSSDEILMLNKSYEDNDSYTDVVMEIDIVLYKLIRDDAFMKKSIIVEETKDKYIISTKIERVENIVLLAYRNTDRVKVLSPEKVILEIKDKIAEMQKIYL